MGLFSTILHVRDTSRERFLPAIHRCLQEAGFPVHESLPASSQGNQDHSQPHETDVGPRYLVSPLSGRWLIVLEAHFAVDGAPWLADMAKFISSALSCHAVALMVHDDDVFYYNLEHDGESLDGYNSCPQYFEQQPLSDVEIDSQRHTPKAFEPILPAGVTVDELHALLGLGWWNAYDQGKLDKDGVPAEKGDGFVFEGERMTAFGELLKLHGPEGKYPYADWRDSSDIPWTTFLDVRYRNC